ncbi:MAG: o-succinylbenzoate synthase [Anaerolineae bacterium]
MDALSMKLCSYTIYRYELPIRTALKRRLGLVLELENEEGKVAFGDIAPLPNWSLETLAEAEQELFRIKDSILDRNWESESISESVASLTTLPSVSFGLESALLQLQERLTGHPIPVCGLLMGQSSEIFSQAEKLQALGFRTLKIKIASLPLAEAKNLLEDLRKRFLLRVDINRAWDLRTALRFFSDFPEDAFDYIEEPVDSPLDLCHFSHPFALDESLREWQVDLSLPKLRALVIKPTLSGSSFLWKAFTNQATKIILSSSFESGIGIAHIASLSAKISKEGLASRSSDAVGIDTYRFLDEDLLEQPLIFEKAELTLPLDLRPDRSKIRKVHV